MATEEASPEDDEFRKDKLHLYIVNASSPLLILTRFAWKNYLVVRTLLVLIYKMYSC